MEINNFRMEDYKYAAQETDGSTMKCLFSRLAETSRVCKQELMEEIERLGDTLEEPLNKEPVFLWKQDLKSADTNTSLKTLFDSCELREDLATKAYEDALDKTNDPVNKNLLIKQYSVIKADMAKIKNLRQAFIKV